ncbi:MAG: sialate O-acetylesterase, partial [Verrucomicrobiota bacterium]
MPMKFACWRRPVALAALTVTAVQSVLADVRLHPLFSDHAVMQRGQPVPVWGWADPGEAVSVEFAGQKVAAQADEQGRWRATLKALAPSATGATLRVTG